MALVNEVYLRLLDVKNVDWKQTCRVALFWRVDRSGDCRSSEDLPANNPARLGVRQILANTGTEPVTAVEALLLTTDSGDGPYHHEYAWRLGSEIRMCRRNDVPSTTNRLIRPLLHQIFGIGPGKSHSINNVVRCRAIQTLRSGAGFRAPGPSSGRQAYPAVDPALEAGARTDSSLAPARASPPSIAMRPRVAARSPIARRIVAGDEVDHRRVCAPLVASLAADAREAEPQLIKRSSHPCAHRHRPLRRARAWRRVCR